MAMRVPPPNSQGGERDEESCRDEDFENALHECGFAAPALTTGCAVNSYNMGRWRGRKDFKNEKFVLHAANGPGTPSFRQRIGHRGGQRIGVRQQQSDLPKLLVLERLGESRHSREANSIGDLPIGLARRIIRDPFSME
jgi:hypothetical protein